LRIAIFDSGIGGLTVLKKALESLPNAEYLYYADTKNVPYGVKQKNEVINHVVTAFDFLSKRNIQIAIIACNTATSAAVSEVRKKFSFPILGMEPAIKPAIMSNSGKQILVLATSLTLRESKLEELIHSLDNKQRIHKRALDKLVVYAEQFNFESDEVIKYIKDELADFDFSEYETIVLGCTHFIYYSKVIQKIVGSHISIIDGNEGTVNNLIKTIKEKRLEFDKDCDKGSITFYSSGIEDSTDRVNKLLKIVKPKKSM
jgi:glutamate racemase